MDRRYMHKSKLFCSFSAFIYATVISASVQAEDNPALMVDLINRIGAIEAENRELRGQVEEARHEVSQLTQRMETLSADVDYRLNNPESGASGVTQASFTPPPTSVGSSPAPKTEPSSSSAKEAYEKARALLEQGDYAAAEHAFAAFVSTYPKDEHAGSAQYWLGVTFFVRGDHEKAVSVFAKGYKNYSKSPKAADNLIKLAKSLGALDRMADACTAVKQLSAEPNRALHEGEIKLLNKQFGCKK